MDSVTTPPPGQATYELGAGEPLGSPTSPVPEEVFGVPHLGAREVVRLVLGRA